MIPCDAGVDQTGHVPPLVDGPRDHVEAERRGLPHALGRRLPEERRPDRAARALHQARHRARRARRRRGPPSTARGRVAPLHVVEAPCWIVRHTVRISGASRLTSASVRQSNDCTVATASSRSARQKSTTALANISGRRRLHRPIGSELRLDVEATRLRRTTAPARRPRASVGMRSPSTGTCCGPLLGVPALRIEAPHVVAPQLGERERVDRRPRGGEPPAVGAAHDVRVERRIVGHHQHAVPGHAEVELERGHADLERLPEPGEGVLGREPPRAAMPWRSKAPDGRTVAPRVAIIARVPAASAPTCETSRSDRRGGRPPRQDAHPPAR